MLRLCSRPATYPCRKSKNLSNSTGLKTVSWSLSPVSHAGWLLKQRNVASMERLLHVYRQVSWPELLKQVWSNNRLSVTSLFWLFMWHHMLRGQDAGCNTGCNNTKAEKNDVISRLVNVYFSCLCPWC